MGPEHHQIARSSLLLKSAPEPVVQAVMATARNLGMALGVGLAGAIFTSVLASAAGGIGASATANPAIFVATRAKPPTIWPG